MERGLKIFLEPMLLNVLVFHLTCLTATASTKNQPLLPALIIFGDSTVDTGNNNNLTTLVKCNHLPYGRDFLNQKPTGRFSNGRVVTDFIADKLGIPNPLAYLNSDAKEENLSQGINFASGASGYYDGTAENFNVIPLSTQLQYFKEYQKKLAAVVGADNAKHLLSNAAYVISTGSNDYVNNYYLNLRLQAEYNGTQYQNFIIELASNFVRELYKLGARKIALLSLPPLGCLPSQRFMHGLGKTGCVEFLNTVAQQFNERLQDTLIMMKTSLPGSKLAYLDSYTTLYNVIQNPSKYGFKDSSLGCCGTGRLAVADICLSIDPGTCQDASNYVFFDSFHPTDATYSILADVLYKQAISQLCG
ncbi:hypothetical protein O6H91_12G003000 [Diphasiastrum complanatum]|uniref:Uncharacterized protein n=1 Tax=Diphasiastrum complanatum TaxID=34168 RepID=A0ACC2BYC2_DIPCM|nr:hypothetical protein O6H91_12G003000 [Diphasiastrum complanatum]